MSLVGFTVLTMGELGVKPPRPHLRTSDYRDRDVACPSCDAKVGVSCHSPNGRKGRPHGSRIKLVGGSP